MRRLTDAQEEQQQKSGRVREMEETLRRLRLKAEEVQQEIAALQVQEAEAHVRLEHLLEKVSEIGRCAPEELWDPETRETVQQLAAEDLDREHRDLSSRLQELLPGCSKASLNILIRKAVIQGGKRLTRLWMSS